MRAVEATITGRRLTLIGLARAWPDAQCVRSPLKALDRLLGNRHLHVEREHIHAAMVRWLVRDNQPVIIRKSAQREREPWIPMASLELSMRPGVGLYARRMQIELSFRDLKSHRYGQGFEDSLTRKGARIEVLLLLSTLAAFAPWLVGMACEASGIDTWLTPYRSKRRLYSVMRRGREALVRRWLPVSVSRLLDQLRQPAASLLDQLGVPA
jgi:hypothetical protein